MLLNHIYCLSVVLPTACFTFYCVFFLSSFVFFSLFVSLKIIFLNFFRNFLPDFCLFHGLLIFFRLSLLATLLRRYCNFVVILSCHSLFLVIFSFIVFILLVSLFKYLCRRVFIIFLPSTVCHVLSDGHTVQTIFFSFLIPNKVNRCPCKQNSCFLNIFLFLLVHFSYYSLHMFLNCFYTYFFCKSN